MELAPCDDSSIETVCSPCLDLSVMPLVELKGTKLEWSAKCCKGGLCNKTTAKPCLFCGHLYAGGPDRIRAHLGISRGGPKHIKVCCPLPIWKKRHGEVVAEIKARLKKEEQQLHNKASKEAAEKSVNN